MTARLFLSEGGPGGGGGGGAPSSESESEGELWLWAAGLLTLLEVKLAMLSQFRPRASTLQRPPSSSH